MQIFQGFNNVSLFLDKIQKSIYYHFIHASKFLHRNRTKKEASMGIELDKKRLIQQTNKYLASKHDVDKKRIAKATCLSIPLVVTYSELLMVLTVFHQELAMLVANKNARRWFKHKAGKFDKLLSQGISRCRKYAESEHRLGHRLTDSRETTTLKDWNRHRGGKAYLVNKVGFAINKPTIKQINSFLKKNRIKNSRIRRFICDFCNQDGLQGVAHLFPMATREATGLFAIVGSGKTHVFTPTRSSRKVHVVDTYPWRMFTDGGRARYECDPMVTLVSDYDLVEAGSKVHISGATFSYGDISGAPLALREKLLDALPLLRTLQV
jgi:hypothetical protein